VFLKLTPHLILSTLCIFLSMSGCSQASGESCNPEVEIAGVRLSANAENPALNPSNRQRVRKEWLRVVGGLAEKRAARLVCEDMLNGECRDRAVGKAMGGGRYSIWYLIDDLHQLRMDFDREDRLESFWFGDKGKWLRTPMGGCFVDISNDTGGDGV
jgi:hypothetical protein